MQTYEKAIKDMPWKGIVHNNATVANLIRKAEIRVLPAVIVVDDKVCMWSLMYGGTVRGPATRNAKPMHSTDRVVFSTRYLGVMKESM